MTRARTVPLLLTCLLSACPRPQGLGMAPLEEAARRVSAGESTPRDQALAGWAAYLVRGQAKEAAPLFAAAAKQGDLWGTLGQAELARRSLDTHGRMGALKKICEVDRQHPLCAVAARALVAATGESPGQDEAIEAAALKALAAGVGGDAAYFLRLAAASARRNRGDAKGARALWAEAGQVNAATLYGPYSRHHYLEWDFAFPPEKGTLDKPGAGPHGPIAARPMRSTDGRLVVSSEVTTADVYYWVSDLTVPDEGRYQLHVMGRGTFRVLLDGTVAVDQRDFEKWLPEERVVELTLTAGRHRLVAKIARGLEHADALWLGLPRADGAPSRLTFAAAQGAAAVRPVELTSPATSYPDADTLAKALEEEVGSALAAFVAARSSAERDEEGALELANSLVEKKASSPLLILRGDALLASRSLPQRIAQGRAHRDYEEALKADPAEASTLQRLSVHARGENRYDEAAELLERARAAAGPSSWRVLLTDMHLAQARGADALADEVAQRALALEPRLCDALELRYDFARRLDAVALADALIKELGACPGHESRQAEHLRLRGDLTGARAGFEAMAEANPLDPQPVQSAAQVALALDKPAEAAAMLGRLERSWPRQATLRKRRAEALERAGDLKGARAEREAALAIDGSDLKLRRALAVQDGKELLEDLKTESAPLLKRYEERHGSDRPTTSGVYVVDASAVEANADGSFTERTHVLAKVLDQAGVSSLAEVHLPPGAEVLTLHTLKADGRVLQPEEIGGKEGMSLPGVEVGDCVEYEYLAATSTRGAAMPGFAAPKFYFRIADGQLFHSTYTVRAPAALGLTVDAHQIEAPAVKREGGYDVVSLEREEMPTYVREPGGPSTDEVLPFVQVGAGAGLTESITSLGDFLVDRAKPDREVARFAKKAAGGREGLAAVKAVYEKVMQEIKGPEASLTTRATATLSQGRGSRLVLLKGALAALSIPSRVVLVKPFSADPASYRFATGDQYAFAALSVKTAEGEAMLSPGIRFAPFGQLAPQAQGQDAVVLPEIGEKLRRFTTPGDRESDGKRVQLSLSLAADGTLSGKGEEVYQGLESAFLKGGLEKMTKEQRKQAIESAVARTFENGTLSDFSIEEKEESGTPVVVRFSFSAPGFARADGNRLVISRGIYPSSLARRFLHQFERKTPLLVGAPEKLDLTMELSLPAGTTLVGAPQTARAQTPFGRYERTETAALGRFAVHETVSLGMARIPPEQYHAFGEFLIAADQAETRELVFEKGPGGLAQR